MRVARVRMRLGLGLLAATLAPVLAPAAARANNDNYACEITPLAVVKHHFKLRHAVKEKNDEGGTDETDGSFTSGCVVVAYDKAPIGSAHPLGLPPNFRVRRGFAKLTILATVQDEGEGGDNWDPNAVALDLRRNHDALLNGYGGRDVTFPNFTMSEDFGVEWGVRADNALSTWRDGDDGFISVQVSSHGGPAGQLLADIAASIVPSFAG